jgi:hypothetical protein
MKAIQEVEHKAGEMIKQAQDQAAEAKRMEQFKRDELASKERDAERKHELALHTALNSVIEGGHKSHLVEAQIDKLQADTLKALADANEQPDEDLEAAGTSLEGDGASPSGDAKKKKKQAKIDPLAKLAEMHGQHLEKHGKTLEALTALAEAIKKPKKIVRDGSGRAAGVE